MSENSGGKPRDDAADTYEAMTTPDPGQDMHPALRPGESAGEAETVTAREAPPLEITDRDPDSHELDTPEVIELSATSSESRAMDDGATWDEPAAAEPGDPSLDERDGQAAMSTESDTFSTYSESEENAEEPVVAPGAQDQAQAESGKPLSKASTLFGNAASRLGLGRLLDSSDQAGQADDDPEPSAPQDDGSAGGSSGSAARAGRSLRSYLDPRLHVETTLPHRRLLAGAAVLLLVCLLANSGGLALIVLSAVLPLLVLITLTQHDVFEKESNLLVAAVAGIGVVVGIVLSWISSWILSSQWFDNGVLNYGAAGFSGRFADAAGTAPFIVWLMVGLVIPAIAIAGIAAGPIGLRRWPQFRNEVMDGMIMTGASAAGFSIGASIVYWSPMVGNPGPETKVNDWTLAILGAGALQPAIITLCGAMIGAGIWRYMIRSSPSMYLLPVIGGVLGFFLLTFGSIQLQSSGIWGEFAWTLVIAAGVFVLYRRVLDSAVATDRKALGTDSNRIVCPSCHKLTPAGAFCAHCGQPLLSPATDAGVPEGV